MNNQERLQKSHEKRTSEARKKALNAILFLKTESKKINFSTVAKQSGVSRNFLYSDEEIRQAIEDQRQCDVNNEINRRARFDKNSKSKDLIIEVKNRRIEKLEEENRKLRAELEVLRGIIYSDRKK